MSDRRVVFDVVADEVFLLVVINMLRSMVVIRRPSIVLRLTIDKLLLLEKENALTTFKLSFHDDTVSCNSNCISIVMIIIF